MVIIALTQLVHHIGNQPARISTGEDPGNEIARILRKLPAQICRQQVPSTGKVSMRNYNTVKCNLT